MDRVHQVDQTVLEIVSRAETTISRPLNEQAVVDNSTIANWIMTFSEFYLAYHMVAAGNVQLLLMDRSLSSTRNNLMYDTSRKRRWKSDCAICDLEIDGLPFDMNEIELARHRILNDALGIPTPRGDYLRYSVIYLLQKSGKAMTPDQTCSSLGIREDDRVGRVKRYLARSVQEELLEESAGSYSINPKYTNSWDRTKKLVLTIGQRLFEERVENPMKIEKCGKAQWLTTRDLALLTLFTIHMLVEACWAKHCLLIGVTKDTIASDFRSHLIPVCVNSGIWKANAERARY